MGREPTFSTHLDRFCARIINLNAILGRNNAVVEEKPKEAKAGQTVVCEVLASRPFAAETVQESARLSRLLVRENRRITAIGFIRLHVA